MVNPESSRGWQSLFLAGAVVLLSWLAAVAPARADGTVRAHFFYSPDCSHCQVVMSEVLPAIRERFGDRVEWRMFDVRAPENYRLLVELEKRYQVKGGQWPEVFVGSEALAGEEAIRQGLAALIEKYLAAGGVDFPSPDLPVAVGTPAPVVTAAGPLTVNLAYFYNPGCKECDRVSRDLEYLQGRYPNLRVTQFNIEENKPLNEVLSRQARLPQEKHRVAPAVFVGNEALVGADVSVPGLEALLDRYVKTGAAATWEQIDPAQLEAASQGIVEEFRSYGALTVIGAGLVDGLNPCAFATVVFFISYLAFVGRSRREMLLVGSAFTLGVFVAYFLVGLGVMQFVKAISGLPVVRQVVYGTMAIACLAFAGTSLHDAWQARRGRPEAMRMRLPRVLRQQVHNVIRQNSSRPAFVAMAALTGFVVSLIELACTGQVYLPTITYVMGKPELRVHAISYLVLYNGFFVLPLVVVFVVASLGVSSSRLAGLVQRQTGLVKLLTAGVFVLLGIWLLVTVV